MAAERGTTGSPAAEKPALAEDDNNNNIIITLQHQVEQSREVNAINVFTGNADQSVYSVSKILEHLSECAEGGEHLDIYQILAFRSTEETKDVTYYQIVFKAVLAMCSQLMGMIVVLWQEVQTGWQYKNLVNSWCPQKEHWTFRIMAFLFCWVVMVFSYESFVTFRYNGMYRINPLTFQNKPDCINPHWVWIGRYINTFVMLLVLYGSFFLVFYSVTATDLVLNAVAMFFMLELDDLFAGSQDYKHFHRFLEHYTHKEDYKISTAFLWFNKIMYYTFIVVVFFTMILAVPTAFYIGVCH